MEPGQIPDEVMKQQEAAKRFAEQKPAMSVAMSDEAKQKLLNERFQTRMKRAESLGQIKVGETTFELVDGNKLLVEAESVTPETVEQDFQAKSPDVYQLVSQLPQFPSECTITKAKDKKGLDILRVVLGGKVPINVAQFAKGVFPKLQPHQIEALARASSKIQSDLKVINFEQDSQKIKNAAKEIVILQNITKALAGEKSPEMGKL